MNLTSRILTTIAVFIAFGYIEASVVVYLRAIYYPDGFSFPLVLMSQQHVVVELAREFCTIVLLAGFGIVAGRSVRQMAGFFLIAFGVWDIFYYVWLKVVLNWPETLLDWDILFLIPLPWIGPVIAPVVISILMLVAGFWIVRQTEKGEKVGVPATAWALLGAGTLLILYSFMSDLDAGLRGAMPRAYRYELLIAGVVLFVAAGYLVRAGSRKISVE
jgi:hypothetical protein